MRIEKLSLKNFRGFKELEIDFPDKEQQGGLAVFIGVNGSGKTSLLNGISYMLHNELFFDIKEDKKKDLTKNINFQANSYHGSLGFVVNNVKSEIINFFVDRENKSGAYVLASGKKLNEKIQTKTSILAYYNTDRFVPSFPSLKAKDINSKSMRIGAIDLQIDEILNFNSFFEWFRNMEDYENEIRLYKNANYRNKALEAIRNAINLFLPEFEAPRVKRQPIEELVLEKNGNILSISQISHGEKLIFALIGDIVKRLNFANPELENLLEGFGLVMVDEIELHLHPSWQRTIIPNLRNTFPNIQFIVTTHSPQVLSNVPRENVFILEGFKLRKYTPHTFGRDANSILYDLFGLEKRPEESEKELSKLYKLIDANDRVKAEEQLDRIKKNLGEGDVEVLRAESYIDLMD